MNSKQAVKMLMGAMGVTQTELAQRLGKTQQSISQKMNVGRFDADDLEEIAKAVGCKFDAAFILPDGRRIEL